MLDIIKDTLIDSIKMLPFLFLSYLLIEYIEHTSSKKIEKVLSKSGKCGPLIGSLLGLIPQCGFSVTASNLYSGRIISLGTLLAVFLSTSDEAIPVLISHPDASSMIKLVQILLTKFVIAFIIGFLVDYFINRTTKVKKLNSKNIEHEHISEICKDCDCGHGILHSTLKHTFSTFIFIVIVSFLLNSAIFLIGEENLSKVLMSGSIFQVFIAGIIGLIPNCASSVLLTELYLSGSITFGAIIAGLSTGAGIGMAVLFKMNKPQKDNFKILGMLYLLGVISGLLVELICRVI